MEYGKFIAEIASEVLNIKDNGIVADYIPVLSKVNPHKYGLNLVTLDNQFFFLR